jgi:hypothetical protein
VDQQGFQKWLDRYVEAWKTYDPDTIGSLFSQDAEYRYHPQDEPLKGRQAIVDNWLEYKDEPGTYDAEYEVLAIDGDMHVAKGWSRYFASPGGEPNDEYHNIYLIRFNDRGEATSFTEYWIQNRDFRKQKLDEAIRKAGGTPAA